MYKKKKDNPEKKGRGGGGRFCSSSYQLTCIRRKRTIQRRKGGEAGADFVAAVVVRLAFISIFKAEFRQQSAKLRIHFLLGTCTTSTEMK